MDLLAVLRPETQMFSSSSSSSFVKSTTQNDLVRLKSKFLWLIFKLQLSEYQ